FFLIVHYSDDFHRFVRTSPVDDDHEYVGHLGSTHPNDSRIRISRASSIMAVRRVLRSTATMTPSVIFKYSVLSSSARPPTISALLYTAFTVAPLRRTRTSTLLVTLVHKPMSGVRDTSNCVAVPDR